MSPTDRTLLDRLRQVFSGYFEMTECRTVAELRTRPPMGPGSSTRPRRHFLVNDGTPGVRLRTFQVFDVAADAYVVDHQLGTLGLVHLVRAPQDPDPRSADAARIRDQLQGRINEAAYLRHLLLESLRPGELQHGFAPYAVEVVFVVATPSEPREMGDILQGIARELTVLHAVGVSLLPYHESLARADAPTAPFEPDPALRAGLHRAFSWLLHLTARWMGSQIQSPRSTTPPPGPPPEASAPDSAAPPPVTTPAAPKTRGFRQFSRPPVQPPFDPRRPGTPAELWLKHFRLRGTRRWCLTPGRMLHLVHGHNGSGKSSFVEAFELVSTGFIDRFASQDHRKVVTHRGTQDDPRFRAGAAAATIGLGFAATTPVPRPGASTSPTRKSPPRPATFLRWKLDASGIPSPLVPDGRLKPGAFRLNQEVLELLTQGTSQDRAQRLFETFFPEGVALFEQSRSLSPRRDAALKNLPTRVRSRFENTTGLYDESRATIALESFRVDAFAWERFAELLPFDIAQLTPLLPLLPSNFESQIRRTGTATTWEPVLEAARVVDQGFRHLLGRLEPLQADLRATGTFFAAYQDATAVALPSTQGDFPDLFRDWLEILAAADLLEREHRLLATFESLAGEGDPAQLSHFPPDCVPRLVKPGLRDPIPTPGQRTEQIAAAQRRRLEAFRRIQEWRPDSGTASSETAPLPPVSQFDLSALDRLADEGIFGREFMGVEPRLSAAVRTAFQEGRIVVCRARNGTTLELGKPDALRKLANQASKAASALAALASARIEFEAPFDGLVGILRQLQVLREIADRLRSNQNQAADQFFERLRTPLGAALNEFTAMLTPARWAYDDIVNRVETTATKPGLGFVQGQSPATSVPAELRLNTAQLSAFALAFFLLCHRAREHPLRLGILDDPFENMDELTVTTVARGLGRYLRLRACLRDGPESWQLLLFLHGEQNVERVRREVACATYLLPWLSPGAQLGNESPITAERSEPFGETLQDLNSILSEAKPPSAPST